MARLGIGTGTNANDGSGDNLRAAGGKINDNFSEIYNYFGDGTNLNFVSGSWNVVNSGINTLSSVGIGTTNPRFTLEVGAVGASGTSLFVNGDAGVTGNVNVSGVSTFAGNITVNGNITGDDASNISGINSATATSLFGDHLVVSGVSTFNDNLELSGANLLFGLSSGASDDRLKFHNSEIYQDTLGFRIIGNTGGISLRADGTNTWSNSAGNEDYIVAIANAGVSLYYNNSKKFETTNTGSVVTGILTATSFSGDGSSLTGVGNTGYINATNLEVAGISTFNNAVNVNADMTFDGAGNNLRLNDNSVLELGTDNDFNIFHNSNVSVIRDGGTGGLLIDSDNEIKLAKNGTGSDSMAVFTVDGPVELYHDNSKKFETTSTGSVVTGILTATSFSGDGSSLTGVGNTGYINATNLVVSGVSTFNNNVIIDGSGDIRFEGTGDLRLGDSNALYVGTGSDLQIYHNGQDSVIRDNGTGDLNLITDSNIWMGPIGAGNTSAKFTPGGASELYYSGNKKIETTNTGSVVTGILTATSFSGDGSSLTGPSRSDVSAATGSIGIGTTTNISITAHKSYGLLKVGISSAAWVRLYVDEASRTSDANRSYLVDPAAGSGLIAEVRTETTGISTFLMTPGVIGWNNDVSVGSTVYAAVTNNETEAANITVTLSVVRIEG